MRVQGLKVEISSAKLRKMLGDTITKYNNLLTKIEEDYKKHQAIHKAEGCVYEKSNRTAYTQIEQHRDIVKLLQKHLIRNSVYLIDIDKLQRYLNVPILEFPSLDMESIIPTHIPGAN